METKKVFYSELAWVLGIVILAIGTSLMEQADFGMSMVVAPAYIIHLKVSEFLPWFTFGMSEYLFQGVLIILTVISVKRFKKGYLFSFVTAVIYGLVLDACIWAVSFVPASTDLLRWIYYFLGMVLCSTGVALLFHTYIAPEAYELFVKETAERYGKSISVVKTAYDCCSCLIGVVMSFSFFGLWEFEGVKLGTVFCALVNGYLIGMISKFINRIFIFRDRFSLRKMFQ